MYDIVGSYFHKLLQLTLSDLAEDSVALVLRDNFSHAAME
jgi:hypothetical protein